ncbi:hypothetical protein N9N67_11690, partial [Bacteriovoracaceae bacterium]|nr:hypothetical protein [Bacteriovoracaceae bacterium]
TYHDEKIKQLIADHPQSNEDELFEFINGNGNCTDSSTKNDSYWCDKLTGEDEWFVKNQKSIYGYASAMDNLQLSAIQIRSTKESLTKVAALEKRTSGTVPDDVKIKIEYIDQVAANQDKLNEHFKLEEEMSSTAFADETQLGGAIHKVAPFATSLGKHTMPEPIDPADINKTSTLTDSKLEDYHIFPLEGEHAEGGDKDQAKFTKERASKRY